MLLAAMTIANAFRRSSALVAPRAGRLASGGRGKPKSGASTAPVAESASAYAIPSMEDVVSLCRKRGFVFGSSEIYNGFNGFYDYGPLGAELKRNIKDRWWRDMVRGRDDVCGLDSSIIGNPKIWEASGHVAGFSDPMVDDRETKKRYRADLLF
jgi:glycyl-tRNA synthetase